MPHSFPTRRSSDVEETGDCDAVKDAARGADSEAEIYAEAERDYQAAWQAGSRCADLETEAKEERAAACELVGELRRHYAAGGALGRSEEHTSELQSLRRISYAVFVMTKKTTNIHHHNEHRH